MKNLTENISNILEDKNKHFISFNNDIYNIFHYSENKDIATKKIDEIFQKLLKFIHYITYVNNSNISQEKIFKDICTFINSLDSDRIFLKRIYNTIPNITQKEYLKGTIGNQLLQNIYPCNRNLEKA